jgi:predicted transcriptional regulator
MNNNYLHLYLGLTRNELKRRLELGLIDSKAIESQIADYSLDLKLGALTDQWLVDHHREQVESDSVEMKISTENKSENKTDKASDLQ